MKPRVVSPVNKTGSGPHSTRHPRRDPNAFGAPIPHEEEWELLDDPTVPCPVLELNLSSSNPLRCPHCGKETVFTTDPHGVKLENGSTTVTVYAQCMKCYEGVELRIRLG